MIVVHGIAELRPEHGRLFVVLGVFDGLHRGHLYLLDELVRAAGRHDARPAVITFDHHPDEVLTGSAPPLLLDPTERLERLAAAGVRLTVVHHFDEATRHTPYDAFIRAIVERVDLAGFLMTPESSFGYERGGTPETVAALGRTMGYDVVVVPTLDFGGRPVRSSEIRRAIAAGDLGDAAHLLGRAYAVVGDLDGDGRIRFEMPVALPPAGTYRAELEGRPATVAVDGDGGLRLAAPRVNPGRRRVVFA